MSVPTVLGFVGLGVMGGPMCGHLAERAGARVLAYDRDGAACERAVAQGAERAGSLAALVPECDIVFLSLPGENDVTAVCHDADGLLARGRPGLVVVDCSTVPVRLSRDLADAFAAAGMHYADAPVAGTADSVRERRISIMVGADEATFRRLSPFLDAMAADVLHCGGAGAGAVTKLLLNMSIAQSVVALAEALTLARAAGVKGETLFEAFRRGCDSFALRQHGMTALLPGDFPEGKFPTRYMLKDVGYAIDLAAEMNLDLDGMAVAYDLLRQSAEAGNADAYWPALIEVIEGKRRD